MIYIRDSVRCLQIENSCTVENIKIRVHMFILFYQLTMISNFIYEYIQY